MRRATHVMSSPPSRLACFSHPRSNFFSHCMLPLPGPLPAPVVWVWALVLGGGRLPPSLARRAILSTATSRGRWPAMCVRSSAFGSHASPSSHAALEMKAGSRRTIASLPVILSSLSELLPDILLARSLLPFTYLRRERLLRTKFLTGSEVYKRMLLHAMLPLSQRQACNSRSRIPSCLTLITVPHYLSPPSLHR